MPKAVFSLLTTLVSIYKSTGNVVGFFFLLFHCTFTLQLAPPKFCALPGTFSLPNYLQDTVGNHCSGKHLHYVSQCQSVLFYEECILGALTTCTYLPEWAQARPCEANITGLTAVSLPSDETELHLIGWCLDFTGLNAVQISCWIGGILMWRVKMRMFSVGESRALVSEGAMHHSV